MYKFKSSMRNDRLLEIFRFLITGGVSFVVDYGVLVALTEIVKFNYLVSSGISFTLSVIVNYIMCVLWVFNDAKNSDKKAMFIFIGSSIIGLLFNQVLMWLFVSVFNIFYMIAKIITTILVMFWNYFAKRMALIKN